MSEANPNVPAPADPLQFDEAQYEGGGPEGPICSICKGAIATTYYEVNGKVICENCRHGIETSLTGGSGATRFLRALAFGALAGLAGFLIYFGVMKLLNLEIGLISILVGFMVGTAVRNGAQGRGGWVYQLLAVFLTYTAIGTSYSAAIIPSMIAELRQREEDRPAQADGEPEAKPGAEAAQNPDGAGAKRPAAPRGGFLLALAVLLGLLLASVYALPVLVGLQQPIGLLIVAFALWEAWKLNAKPRIVLSGPFRVGEADGPPAPGVPGHA